MGGRRSSYVKINNLRSRIRGQRLGMTSCKEAGRGVTHCVVKRQIFTIRVKDWDRDRSEIRKESPPGSGKVALLGKKMKAICQRVKSGVR